MKIEIYDKATRGPRVLAATLADLLEILGEEFLSSYWQTTALDGVPEEAISAIERESKDGISGSDLLSLSREVLQIIDGVFVCSAHGKIIAEIDFVDGEFVSVDATDAEVIERIRRRYQDVRNA